MEKIKEFSSKVRKSFFGEWLYAGGYGFPIALVSTVMYLAPAIIILGYLGYGETTFREPFLWMWAGSACGVYVGLSEGKRIARAESKSSPDS